MTEKQFGIGPSPPELANITCTLIEQTFENSNANMYMNATTVEGGKLS